MKEKESGKELYNKSEQSSIFINNEPKIDQASLLQDTASITNETNSKYT